MIVLEYYYSDFLILRENSEIETKAKIQIALSKEASNYTLYAGLLLGI